MQEMKTDDYAELKTDMAVDSFYTGWWLLKGFKIIFVDDSPDETNKFRQEFILSRRELPLPATTSET